MLSLDNSRSTTTSTSSRKRNYRIIAMRPVSRRQRGRTHKNKTRGDDAAAAATVPSPVICLTGLTPVEKDHYHALIVKLGGRFTRNLDSSVNTHLVSRTAEGAKYQAACDIPHLQIVQPTWLDACAVQQAWMDARPYSLSSSSSSHTTTTTSITTSTTTLHQDTDGKKKHRGEENSLPQPLPMEPLLPQLQQQLAVERADDCQLFMDCHAFLVGFDNNNNDDDNVSSSQVVKANLARLFRRGMGTIHWTVQDNMTHIIVADGLEEKVRDAARLLADQHINFPSIVSPRWIVASWEKNQLLDETKYAPRYKRVRTVVVAPKVPPMPGKKPKAAAGGRENTLPFRGSLFCFLRISPPENVVDFNRHELLDLVTTAGGQTLTTEMMQALRMDKARSGGGGGVALSLRRTCFVVCWGAYQDESNLAMHALLAQMKREELSDIVPVTPLWIQTVVAEQKLIPPAKFAQLFVPPTRPLRKLVPVVTQTQGKKLQKQVKSMASTPTPLCVCVTGFAGMRRQAIKFSLQAMGATYDDSLRPSTTHLICQEAAGSKFEKAQEWNIHTVSIDWLYHVAAYGYHGRSSSSNNNNNKNGDKEEKEDSRNGCEARFCIRATSTATTTTSSSTITTASSTCRDKNVQQN